jgi:hypothetical protein
VERVQASYRKKKPLYYVETEVIPKHKQKNYLTMKPILSLTFSFFLFVLIVNLSLDFPNDALEQVLDVTTYL